MIRSPGRPRAFDLDEALAVGQSMFHAQGYASVGLAALTSALNIKPPSFYKAFGSKAAFFTRILERYTASVLVLDEILLAGRPAEDALGVLLLRAAASYAAFPEKRGCLVLETLRGGDPESAALARRVAEARRAQIRAFVARSRPEIADRATDYVASTLCGLSGSAREGMDAERLRGIAEMARYGLRALFQAKAGANGCADELPQA